MPYVLWLLAFLFVAGTPTVSADDRPNILFLLTDDLAPDAVGFAGSPQVRTPHLDRLAREGAVLRNAFCVTPVCSPSRASIVTSRYGSQLDILDWINPAVEPERGLNPNTVTWMELLQEVGYATALVGKWHLGTALRFHPTLQGYDHFTGFLDGGRPTRDPVFEVGGHNAKQTGFTADVTADFALQYLETHAVEEKPFALSVHFREPHAPWLPAADEDRVPYEQIEVATPQPSHPLLDTPRMERITREYYASVASVDRNVGRILEALDRLKIAERTVVIFTSDHGYHVGHHGLLHKGNATWLLREKPPQEADDIPRGQRPNLYDQALRIPAVVRWPGRIAAGTEIRDSVTHLDWYPTLLSIAGIDRPRDIPLYGRDMLGLLRGEPIDDWSNEFYIEYSMRHGARADMRGWRTPDWKLIIDLAHPARTELYDLKTDPLETANLATSPRAEHAEIRDQLRVRILERMREIQDPLLLGELEDRPPTQD